MIDMAKIHSKLTTSALWPAGTELNKTTSSRTSKGVKACRVMYLSRGVEACIAGRDHLAACMVAQVMMILGRTQA